MARACRSFTWIPGRPTAAWRWRGKGVDVVELDASQPFTPGRARNAGLGRLRGIAPEVRFVQFVDGDCEMAGGWFRRGHEAMRQHEDAAIMSGRVRERHPEASVYARLCDIEWDAPLGEVGECGGLPGARQRGGGRGVQRRPDRRGRAGAVPSSSPPRVEDCANRRGNGAARCGDDALCPVVEAGRANRLRLYPRRLSARSRSPAISGAQGCFAGCVGADDPGGLGSVGLAHAGVVPSRFGPVSNSVRADWLSSSGAGKSAAVAALYAGSILLAKFAQLVGLFRFAAGCVTRRRPDRSSTTQPVCCPPGNAPRRGDRRRR